ncbi:TPA: hypothetical protein EYP66_22115 [Candidatus Poribacteria bacterium]|nr:hypothetical protein [Candidatus Poribacteria bacterium]
MDRGPPQGTCLPEPELTGYTFPDATAEYRFEDVGDWCKANKENYTIIWVGDLWERATFILYSSANFCESLCIAVSDDYGTQNAIGERSEQEIFNVLRRDRDDIHGAVCIRRE